MDCRVKPGNDGIDPKARQFPFGFPLELSARTGFNSPVLVVVGAAMDGGVLVIVVVIIVGLVAAISFIQKARRRKFLTDLYGAEIAEKIIAKQVWQGMTTGQLIESWGQPEDRDETVYKTKTKQTWKYGNNGKNRYRQRVYIENDCVVGWQNQ